MREHRVSAAYHPHWHLRAKTAMKSTKRLLMENTRSDGSPQPDNLARAIMQHRNTPDSEYEISPAQWSAYVNSLLCKHIIIISLYTRLLDTDNRPYSSHNIRHYLVTTVGRTCTRIQRVAETNGTGHQSGGREEGEGAGAGE